jgi:effector-binding domain-containing protein
VKWLFALVLVAVLAAAGLFGVGYYVLPAKTEVSRSIEIDRPASIIYPLVANLRTFNEISPWFDRDPKADYQFTGPREGEGQAAAWVSSVRTVGSGSQKIVSAKENERVDLALDLNGQAAKATWLLQPGRNDATNVTWTITIDCGADPRQAPCRYLALIARTSVQRDIEFALAALKKLAERLPALEIASLKPEFVTVQQQDFAYVEGDTGRDAAAIDSALRDSLALVSTFLKNNGLMQAGPPMAVNITLNNEKASFRAGMPYSGPTPVTQLAVKTGKTPSGLTLKVIAVGTREAMKPTYARIEAYLLAHRLTPAGGSWEVYIDDPTTTPEDVRRTAIYYPRKDTTSASRDTSRPEKDLSASPP